jgi:uncharacterized protein (DUF362 family)
MDSKISLVKSKDHYGSMKQVLLPWKKDIRESIEKIDTVVIKINLVITRTPRHPDGVELAITPVETVRGFIDFISPFYNKNIVIVEETCWGNTKEGFLLYGYENLARKYSNVELLDMKDDDLITKTIAYSQGELILPFSKTIMEAPFLVSITRPKVHCNAAMTAGIKNIVIGAVEGYKNRKSLHTKKDLHEIIASIAKIILPDLSIIDGVVGMEESGPIQGKEIQSGWVLASMDALAADSLAAYLMDFNVDGIPYMGRMRTNGLGKLYTKDKIEILGENPVDLVTHFKPYRKFADDLRKETSK